MRPLANARAAPQPAAGQVRIQRKCACAASGESCARCAPHALQRKGDGGQPGPQQSPLVDNVLATAGAPLAAPLRATMEARFNHDFSAVRVHSDDQAAASARAESAVAFASGSHVVLGAAAMNAGPRSQAALMAHELAHVVQQQRGAHLPGAGTDAALEAEADQAANRFSSDGGHIAVHGVAGPGLARAPAMPAVADDLDTDSEDEDEEPGAALPRNETRRSFVGLGADDRRKPVTAEPVKAPPVKSDEAAQAQLPAAAEPGAAVPPPPRAPEGDADAPRPSPFLPHEDAFNIVLGMRAAEDALPAWQIDPARKQVDELSTPAGKGRNTRRINKLARETAKLGREIKKMKEDKTPASAPQLKALLRERSQKMAEKSFLQKDATVLGNKLRHAPGGPGASTHTSKTYAIVELADAQGNPLARIVAVNRKLRGDDPADVKQRIAAIKASPKKLKKGAAAAKKGAKSAKARTPDPGVHAEEAITIAIEQHIKSLPPKEAAEFVAKLKGGRMHVTVDQEVCAGVCQPRLRTKAAELGLDKVSATTVHAVDPQHHGKPELTSADLVKAKQTATALTDSNEVARLKMHPDEMATRTETIFQKGVAELPPPAVARLERRTLGVIDVDAPHEQPLAAPVKAAVAAPHDETKAAVSKAAAPVAHEQPKAAPPKAAPAKAAPAQAPASRLPSRDAVTNKLNQADMALGAVRDYQRYKQEYIDAGDSKPVAEAKAAARAGVTFGANLKGGKLGQVVNAANAFDAATKAGQSKDEAAATTIGTIGGGLIAKRVAPGGPAGAAIQLLNTGAQVLGAPQGVQDATSIAADLVPSSIVSTTITTGARSWHALGKAATGDLSSIDKLGKDMETGATGPWLQGYAQWTGIAADMASGDDFSKALDKAAKTGKGSWADRTGSALADAASDLGQNKEALAGKYGPVAGGMAVGLNVLSGLARGEDFSKALAHTQKDAAEGEAALKARGQQQRAALKKAASDAASTVKKEAAAVLSQAGTAVSTSADQAQKAVAAKVSEVRHQIDPVIDNMVTGAADLASRTGAVLEREAGAGRRFVSEQAASARNMAKAGWHKLWGN